ncbi:unnamed protein product [Callosobruchus maculatus]|uniref:Uncharacterized protein n=1 Tax=Callosobruchus maculatus TaxID=64391 RepID=A0A653C9D8_CALMS|nr:unnamed protein product [Callosobruchus maculatus]
MPLDIAFEDEEKQTKYQDLLGQLRRLSLVYTVSLLIIVMEFLEEYLEFLVFCSLLCRPCVDFQNYTSITYYDPTAYRCPNFITIDAAVTEIIELEERQQTDRPSISLAKFHHNPCGQTDRPRNRWTNRQTDIPTERQTDRPIEQQTGRK